MALTKTYASCVAAGTSNGAALTTTGTTIPLATAYAAVALIEITNGASAPATSCVATLYVSADDTIFYVGGIVSGGTVPSAVTTGVITIDAPIQYAYVSFTGNTTNAVTVEAQIAYVTAL